MAIKLQCGKMPKFVDHNFLVLVDSKVIGKSQKPLENYLSLNKAEEARGIHF